MCNRCVPQSSSLPCASWPAVYHSQKSLPVSACKVQDVQEMQEMEDVQEVQEVLEVQEVQDAPSALPAPPAPPTEVRK